MIVRQLGVVPNHKKRHFQSNSIKVFDSKHIFLRLCHILLKSTNQKKSFIPIRKKSQNVYSNCYFIHTNI